MLAGSLGAHEQPVIVLKIVVIMVVVLRVVPMIVQD